MPCCCSMNRRQFVGGVALGVAAGVLGLSASAAAPAISLKEPWDPERPQLDRRRKLILQPLLRHQLETRRERTSWRNWGGVHTPEAAREECARIQGELEKLAASAGFPLEILPLAVATNDAEAARVRDTSPADVLLLYAAGAGMLDPCITRKRHTIIFVRHRSGPVYDWYENVSNRFLRVPGPDFEYDLYRNFEGVGVDDIVVDDYDEILWRLRALGGLKNFLGTRALTIGKASGKGCPKAPEVACAKYGMEIIEVPYEELDRRIKARRAESPLAAAAGQWTGRLLAQPGVTLDTDRRFIVNAFLLYTVFKDLIHEHQADHFTIGNCMSTVMPIADTTACLALSLLADEGYTVFCESDFASHPAGVLLRAVAGRPVFMHNPTFPHKGMLTCAHCACPRRLDGAQYDPIKIVTHYESDFGASTKIEQPVGREITLIDPDAAQVRWLGLKARVIDNPAFSICRSQQDVEVIGDWKKLAREIRGSHWMMAAGDYLNEMGYAAQKLGLEWLNISS